MCIHNVKSEFDTKTISDFKNNKKQSTFGAFLSLFWKNSRKTGILKNTSNQ